MDSDPARGNFADWLFDAQSADDEFSDTGLPFREGGLGPAFHRDVCSDHKFSLSPSSEKLRHQLFGDYQEVFLTPQRREEILDWFREFRSRQPRFDLQMLVLLQERNETADQGSPDLPDSKEDLPGVSLIMLQDCLNSFWFTVAARVPVVHQATFSPNSCPILLLLVIVALGAACLKSQDPHGRWSEYGAFAECIMVSVRWEIMASEDMLPFATLWVAQALLLVEYYEKLYSTRQLHERALVHHASFLTLLRKGGPLIGRFGLDFESPGDGDDIPPDMVVDARTWWFRWAETQAMHRVIFVTFMMDILHAAIFGHTAIVGAHEIRLPLPCDDCLWTATTPESVRQLDANLKIYGVREVFFLDGLKRTLHGKDVNTDSFGRMILLCGVLSIGWHLNHHATDPSWLELRNAVSETREKWRELVLDAFREFPRSFDISTSDSLTDEAPGLRSLPNGPVNSAYLLVHFAHISIHADTVDLQVYGGAQRVQGRKIGGASFAAAASRLATWARQPRSRLAVLHAFKLLYRILVDPNPGKRHDPEQTPAPQYSVLMESDLHRPWIIYLSTLTIWTFVRVLGGPPENKSNAQASQPTGTAQDTYERMIRYVTPVSAMHDINDETVETLHDGLLDLLEVVTDILTGCYTDLLMEARNVLAVCKTRMPAVP
ncbi:hypothetical protein E4U42_004336 [Claviceps africana]|uniref:Xylanolytic transcriptional activator regulatory domain-containing protein n=1 Tax=Claviceps africana TaxID=83212 RepID=A0A8K0J5F0_9HYPO|nr:hypothetical protein E4U42_004336 [Claviceps africana]